MTTYLEMRPGSGACTSLFVRHRVTGKVLYGHRQYSHYTERWTTPGGRCTEGESLGECLLRETEEETSISDVEVGSFLGVVPGAKEGDTLYVFEGATSQEPELMEPEKFSQWCWWDPAETPPEFINPAALKLFREFVAAQATPTPA